MLRWRATCCRVRVVPCLGILHSIQRQQHVQSVLRALPGGSQRLLCFRSTLFRRLDVFITDVDVASSLIPLQLRQLNPQVFSLLLGVQSGRAGLTQLLQESQPDTRTQTNKPRHRTWVPCGVAFGCGSTVYMSWAAIPAR